MKHINDITTTDKGSYKVTKIILYKGREIYQEEGIRKGFPIKVFVVEDSSGGTLNDSIAEAKQMIDTETKNETRTGRRIYRQKSYQNKPYVLYEGTQKLGSFQTIGHIHERYPDAVFVEAKPTTITPYTPKVKRKL